ncbi:MAG TPA: MFS transporter, partial [Longimicrobium sp.]|nr:MFS transporter [Longimicrobium sp.]
PERRGTAMGVVMGGFSAASVLGLPFGLSLAERGAWETPFLFLAAVTAVVFVIAAVALPSMRGHLTGRRSDDPSPFSELLAVAREPRHVRAFLLTTAIMFSAFTVVPFLSAYLVENVGMPETRLDLIYLVGGVGTIITGPFLWGPLADRFGHARAFTLAAMLSIIPITTVTNLPRVSMPVILVVTTLMMVMASGRMISVTALITGVVEPRRRGSFMSLNSSIQQGAAGAAAMVAGLLIGGGEGQPLTGYNTVGWVAIGATLLTLALVGTLRQAQVPAHHSPFEGTGAPPLAEPMEAPREPAEDRPRRRSADRRRHAAAAED